MNHLLSVRAALLAALVACAVPSARAAWPRTIAFLPDVLGR
jgi:hypothetical protein